MRAVTESRLPARPARSPRPARPARPRPGRTARLRLVVMGILGQLPFAGVSWQVLHYLEGLRRLGHDVYYVEDTGAWSYDPHENTVTDDPRAPVRHIGQVLRSVALADRWAYRSPPPQGSVWGPVGDDLDRLFATADALINLTGSTALRDEHRAIPTRIYLETDPVAAQIEREQGWAKAVDALDDHTCHFTFGENIGTPRCPLPTGGIAYHATRQPVVLDWWEPPSPERTSVPPRFTTVASWKQSRDVSWEGETYHWSKHREFEKVMSLPTVSPMKLELALASIDDADRSRLRAHGWEVVDALGVSRSLDDYRAYILRSDGEFTVAKDQNVRFRSGWFSDRSACYLAAGKPVVTQDTGFADVLPVGRGLFAFGTIDDILAAFDDIAADYAGQSRAARAIAEEHFAAERVLTDLLTEAGLV